MSKHLWLIAVGAVVLAGCGSSQPASTGYSPADFAKRPPPAGFTASHSGPIAPPTPPPAK